MLWKGCVHVQINLNWDCGAEQLRTVNLNKISRYPQHPWIVGGTVQAERNVIVNHNGKTNLPPRKESWISYPNAILFLLGPISLAFLIANNAAHALLRAVILHGYYQIPKWQDPKLGRMQAKRMIMLHWLWCIEISLALWVYGSLYEGEVIFQLTWKTHRFRIFGQFL